MKRTALRRTRKRKSERGPWRSEAYLDWIRARACCLTGRTDGVVAHHLLRGTSEKCMGRRSGDNYAIPLHWTVHDALHADGNETRFLSEYGIDDGPALATEYHRVWAEQGLRVVRGPATEAAE